MQFQLFMLSIEYLTMEQSPQLLFLKKRKHITAKILEYVPFSLSLFLWETFSSRTLLSHELSASLVALQTCGATQSPTGYKYTSMTNELFSELRPCGVGVFCRVRALFLQMIKESCGQSPLKKEM